MTTEFKASCLCGQLTVRADVANERLPMDVYLCSCNTCRWLSGHLAITAVNLHQAVEVHGKATKYATSTGPRGLYRCFCPICGAFVYEDSESPDRISISGGVLEKSNELLSFKRVIYAGDTVDGGLSVWLPNHPAYKEDCQGEDVELFVLSRKDIKSDAQIDPNETLPCSCLCGAVKFRVSRPTKESYNLSSPYSDSIAPAHLDEGVVNHKDEKWWIRGNGNKYAAAVCACNSCRKASGHDIVQWAFIPAVNILDEDNKPFNMDTGVLTSYTSSKGAKRLFCSTCGAKAFLTLAFRPHLVDVSVGLMRSRQGSRAEDWLDWLTQRISFIEEAQNTELVGALKVGMDQAHARRGF